MGPGSRAIPWVSVKLILIKVLPGPRSRDRPGQGPLRWLRGEGIPPAPRGQFTCLAVVGGVGMRAW